MKTPIELPPSKYLRRGVVRQYLGIDDDEFSKLVRNGVFVPRYLQGEGRAWFIRDEILEAEASNKIFSPTRTTQKDRK